MPVEDIAILREGAGDERELKAGRDGGSAGRGKDAEVNGRGPTPCARTEGIEKVTGRCYAYDMRLPGQLYVAALRSPYPHARIRRIDTTQAEALTGVHAVLSSANAPDITWYEEECALFAKDGALSRR